MIVVLDANVFMSAMISPQGAPAEILRLWEQAAFDVAISPAILQEIDRVIHYPKIQKKYNLAEKDIETFFRLIDSAAVLVTPTEMIDAVEQDETDNRYVECAVAANASYIVTGNKHLLGLKAYQSIEILRPAAFLKALGAL